MLKKSWIFQRAIPIDNLRPSNWHCLLCRFKAKRNWCWHKFRILDVKNCKVQLSFDCCFQPVQQLQHWLLQYGDWNKLLECGWLAKLWNQCVLPSYCKWKHHYPAHHRPFNWKPRHGRHCIRLILQVTSYGWDTEHDDQLSSVLPISLYLRLKVLNLNTFLVVYLRMKMNPQLENF